MTPTMLLNVSLAWASASLQSALISVFAAPHRSLLRLTTKRLGIRGTQIMATLRAWKALDKSMSTTLGQSLAFVLTARQGGRGACIGRFACCTIMTILFLSHFYRSVVRYGAPSLPASGPARC
jgi:hypothetical protein